MTNRWLVNGESPWTWGRRTASPSGFTGCGSGCWRGPSRGSAISRGGGPRSVPDPGLGDDAGADDGGGGDPLLRAVPRPVPRRPGAGGGRRGRGPEGVGGAGLLPPGPAASRGGPDDRRASTAGPFPTTPTAIRALPGVGRYIAGAILSFAFDRPAPIVEANTQRVLARWLACRERPEATSRRRRGSGRPPSGSSRRPAAGTFNQAFMELGALVCTPRAPLCLVCPVAAECRARALGIQDAGPGHDAQAAPAGVAGGVRPGRRGRAVADRPARRRGASGNSSGSSRPSISRGPTRRGGRLGEPIDLAEGVRRLTGVRVRIGPLVTTDPLQRDPAPGRARRPTSAVGLSDDPDPGPGPGAGRLGIARSARQLSIWIGPTPPDRLGGRARQRGRAGPTRRRADVGASRATGRRSGRSPPAAGIPSGGLAWTPIVL